MSPSSSLGAVALAAALSAGLATPGAMAAAGPWQTSWYAAPHPVWDSGFALPTNVPADVSGHTVREVVRLSAGGPALRVVLSNRYGTAPLRVGAVRVARTAGAPGATSAIDAASDRAVTFGGRAGATIPAGGTLVSDPAGFAVGALERLTVSAWFPAAAPLTTFHWGAQQTGYIAPGDATASVTLPGAALLHGRAFVAGVQVMAARPATIVALGDSLTDGNGSTPDLHRRWPDFLAARLAPRGIGVANAGISGARLLSTTMGVKAAERFDGDVLDQPGVAAVVITLGSNDIGWPGSGFAPHEGPMTVQRLIDGYRALIARAHARGVKVIGGTLVPFGGALPGTPFAAYWNADKEQVRQAFNAWIRTSPDLDAVADFDAALRDPANPTRMLPAYDSGDHLHPGDAGYAAMAQVAHEAVERAAIARPPMAATMP